MEKEPVDGKGGKKEDRKIGIRTPTTAVKR